MGWAVLYRALGSLIFVGAAVLVVLGDIDSLQMMGCDVVATYFVAVAIYEAIVHKKRASDAQDAE